MMESFEAVKVVSRHRDNTIIVAAMTTNPELAQMSTTPDLDLPFMAAMGKASSLGLGLALARPDKKVIVLDGDGSLLMNLGTLVTIANMAPPNLIHFVFENGVYRTTGGQPIPNAGKVSFATLARGAGYTSVYEIEDIEILEDRIKKIINQTGPTFVCLKVAPATERPPFPSVRTRQVISRFRTALQYSSP